MNFSISRKISVGILMATANFCFAQDKAEAALKKFEENYPQEKIHLLLSKNSFVAGENLWFTSFVFEGYSPSTISTNIFIELYDQNKKLISKKLYPLIKGKGSGSITLPEDLKEDVYYLRAYTTWMGNFSDEFNEIQPILVYNPSSPERLVKDTISPWTAEVFPEGGTFIDGIQTKFAVRLKSRGETPSEWEGYVTESSNPEKKIVSFKGFDQNVGSFSFIPQFQKKYLLTIVDGKGSNKIINLPKVLDKGIHFEVQNINNTVRFKLKSKNIDKQYKYKILGSINNKLIFEAEIDSSPNKVYELPKNNSIHGVLYFTVLDQNNNVVAKRLCFVDKDKTLQREINFGKILLDFNSKAENKLEIQEISKLSNYTIKVVDAESDNSNQTYDLLSSIYLTGDFKSKLYQPNQYFDHRKNPDALDAILISEQWKRFEWNSIINGIYPIISKKPSTYLSYKGRFLNNGKPASNEEINLLFKEADERLKFEVIKTDINGFFNLDRLFFEDKMQLSYQLNKSKISEKKLQLFIQPENLFLPLRSNLPESCYTLKTRDKNEKNPKFIEEAITSYQLNKYLGEKFKEIEEVKIKSKRVNLTDKMNRELSSTLFKGHNEIVFDFVNDNNLISHSGNILDWLKGRTPGVDYILGGSDPQIRYRGSRIPLFIDEFQVQVDQINNLSPSDIAMIKFIRSDFRGVNGGAVGAIAIYTRRADMISNSNDKKSLIRDDIYITGYNKEVPFINNIYEDERLRNIAQDKRDVLYWNPYVESKPSEPTVIQWYNNDDAKKFKVIIIGFDENNDLLYYNKVLDQSK
ncbi:MULTISPECIES: hypothetical protein [Chryseobacterium]|uniref:TonB-dependent Receptor Plug Domain n=1 Tax=Chryseobacterium taihuense TaxID=1141221 RepID=A0A4U8W8B6_9FLAO|nr:MULTISPECIES: hypothetical protein [Chryseobacterium]QQV04138.1 hypothetical protein I6I61_07330 [Chryseobacterium sp. FDAARGOS 1104]VFB02497.1 Uncharacterised protein [Chryseobacterium taihuense]